MMLEATRKLLHFNSIKVRLEPKNSLPSWLSLWNFNSIKVRLEQVKDDAIEPVYTFQFHKGTIRTQFCSRPYFYLKYFNSIKVRLEHQFWRNVRYPQVFQFHKGTIRTLLSEDVFQNIAHLHFNSIKVRLEPYENAAFLLHNPISIP